MVWPWAVLTALMSRLHAIFMDSDEFLTGTGLTRIQTDPETRNICITFAQRRPNNGIQMFCVYWEPLTG